MLRIGLRHRLAGDLQTEPFKGALWHGVFGACLHDLAPGAFDALMRAEVQQRRWALRPPLELDGWIPAGAALDSELLLIGDAAAHAPACVAAADEMGRRGFGPSRVPAPLEAVWGVDAAGRPVPLSGAEAPVTALDVYEQAREVTVVPAATSAELELRLLSPLRLKAGNELLRELPDYRLLVRRSVARLVMNLPEGDVGLFAPGEHAALMEAAAAVPLVAHRVDGVQWLRRSARQRRVMPFEGLLGTLVFGPGAAAAYPWLALAEWWQLGGKTTFGLGVVEARLRPVITALGASDAVGAPTLAPAAERGARADTAVAPSPPR